MRKVKEEVYCVKPSKVVKYLRKQRVRVTGKGVIEQK